MRFLRETLTVMAGLVLLALMAALAGPWFVDWNRYRAFAEKTLSEALGAPVTIGGQIGLKLLPTPRLNLSDVRLSLSATGSDAAFGQLRTNAGARAPAAMTARVERIQLELGIAPLLRGKWQFVEARIERPDINLRLADDGSLLLPKPATAAAGQIAFENVIIVNARVAIEMAGGAQLALGGIDMRASGASLAGPFRGEGHMRLGDQTPAFFFNTGVAEEEGLRFKFITEAAGALPRFEYEALASLAGGMAAAASTRLQHVLLAGQARIAGQQPRAWNASGALRIGEGSAVFAPFELRTGDAETGISVTGEMQYNFSRQLAQIQIEAPRIDADQLAGGRVAPADALGNLQGWIAGLVEGDVTGVRLPVAFDISLKTPALTLGGETLGDVSARLVPQGGRQAQLHFSGQFPGRTAISLEGVAETGSAAKFSGKIDAHFRDLERFSAWAQRGAHVFNSAATALRDLHVAGGVEISRAGFLGRDLTIATGRSRFRGLVSYLREGGSGRPRLAINVASPELNLDSLPDMTAPMQALGGADLSFRLDANAVRLARVGGGKLDSGLIGIELRREAGVIELVRLQISNLGGASVSARGKSEAGVSRIEGELHAQRLVEFAETLQRVFPGAWSDALRMRAPALSPARLTFAMSFDTSSGANLKALRIAGEANATRIDAEFQPSPASAGAGAVKLTARNDNAYTLVRQLGLPAQALASRGTGELSIEAGGDHARGYTTKAVLNAAGVTAHFAGNARALFPAANLDGDVKITSADASHLLKILGLANDRVQFAASTDISARLRWKEADISIAGLRGELAGVKFAGDLRSAPREQGGETARIATGRLRFDRLELSMLAALVLGPPREPGKGEVWSSARFAPALVHLPRAEIETTAGEFLTGGFAGALPRAESARFMLHLAPGHVGLRKVAMKLPGGPLNGQLEIRRSGENALVAGTLDYRGALQPEGNIEASGTLSAGFSGTGASPLALINGLAGKGQLKLDRLSIAETSPRAVDEVIARASDEQLDVSAKSVLAHFERALAQGSYQLQNQLFTLSMAGGQAVFSPTPDENMSMTLDVRTLVASLQVRMKANALPDGWKSELPYAVAIREGRFGEFKKRFDVAALVNVLGARAIEREALRVELLEIDIRERAMFNRHAKLREFVHLREGEITHWRAAREREALELKRKAEEAERKAEAERKRLEEETQRKTEAAKKRQANEEISAANAARRAKPAVAPAPRASSSTGAPLQLAPVAPAAPAPAAPILNAPADPSASGRY